MQQRADSKGRTSASLSKKSYSLNARPPAQAVYRALEKKDIFKEFKNSVHTILSNYHAKKAVVRADQNSSNLNKEEAGSRSQMMPRMTANSSQKSISIARPTPLAIAKPFERKSKSTSSLKTTGILGLGKGPARSPGLGAGLLGKSEKLSAGGLLDPAFGVSALRERISKGALSGKVGPVKTVVVKRPSEAHAAGEEARPEFGLQKKHNFFRPMKAKGNSSVPRLSSTGPVGKPLSASKSGSSLRGEEKPIGSNLEAFVTKVSEVEHSGVEAYPFVPHKLRKSGGSKEKYYRPYFFDEMIATYEGNHFDGFPWHLFRLHMSQTLQSMMVLSRLDLKNYRTNGKEISIPPFRGTLNLRSGGQPHSPPSSASRKTVVFDLDETLIHCNEDQTGPCDLRVPVVFPTGEKIMAGINIRPMAKEVLEELAGHFEIVIFTASHSCYANPVIDYFDEKCFISARMFREHCSQVTEGLYTKDLRVIKNRDLKDVVLIDNAVYSFILNMDNGVPIIPFYNSDRDFELVKLKNFLLSLKDVEDVRPHIRQYFEWDLFLKFGTNPDKLFKSLLAL